MCKTIPTSRFHVIFDCDYVNTLWREIEPTLIKLHQTPLTQEEKGFGIPSRLPNSGIIIGNWLTFSLRAMILKEEQRSFYKQNTFPDPKVFKKRFNLA